MLRKIGFGLLWLGFVLYAFLLAPPSQPDTLELIKNLSTGQLAGINPLVIALFNVMGVLPLLYCCFLFVDGRGQSIRAWIFAALAFGVGAFALIPYLGLRQSNPEFVGEKTGLVKLFDARLTAILLTLATLGLLSYGITQGNWADFWQQWRTSRFIHVMSLDFCLLTLLFPALLGDDMARRGLSDRRIFGAALVPLLGALSYLCLRPPLQRSATPQPVDVPTS